MDDGILSVVWLPIGPRRLHGDTVSDKSRLDKLQELALELEVELTNADSTAGKASVANQLRATYKEIEELEAAEDNFLDKYEGRPKKVVGGSGNIEGTNVYPMETKRGE